MPRKPSYPDLDFMKKFLQSHKESESLLAPKLEPQNSLNFEKEQRPITQNTVKSESSSTLMDSNYNNEIEIMPVVPVKPVVVDILSDGENEEQPVDCDNDSGNLSNAEENSDFLEVMASEEDMNFEDYCNSTNAEENYDVLEVMASDVDMNFEDRQNFSTYDSPESPTNPIGNYKISIKLYISSRD